MRNLSDKELDELFKDKMENALVEPPPARWAAIEKELQVKPKRRLPVYWLAAALAVVALSAGLLFNKEEKIQLQGKTAIVQTENIPSTAVQAVKPAPKPLVEASAAERTVVITLKERVAKNEEKSSIALQPLVVKTHHPINEGAAKTAQVETPNVQIPVEPTEEVLMAQVHSPTVHVGTALQEQEPDENNGIRNVGDLVNFVVDKVDKRERKFLKFKTDDEDNSSLIAINIGIIKLNAKEK